MSDDIMYAVQRALGEISSELKAIRADYQNHFIDDKENFGRIDSNVEHVHSEVKSLQKKLWFGTGFAAAVGSLMTLWFKH